MLHTAKLRILCGATAKIGITAVGGASLHYALSGTQWAAFTSKALHLTGCLKEQ